MAWHSRADGPPKGLVSYHEEDDLNASMDRSATMEQSEPVGGILVEMLLSLIFLQSSLLRIHATPVNSFV